MDWTCSSISVRIGIWGIWTSGWPLELIHNCLCNNIPKQFLWGGSLHRSAGGSGAMGVGLWHPHEHQGFPSKHVLVWMFSYLWPVFIDLHIQCRGQQSWTWETNQQILVLVFCTARLVLHLSSYSKINLILCSRTRTHVQPLLATKNGHSPSLHCISSLPLWWQPKQSHWGVIRSTLCTSAVKSRTAAY